MTRPSERLLMAFSSSQLGEASSGSMARSAESVICRFPLPLPAAPRQQESPLLKAQAGELQACNGGISGNSWEIALQGVKIFRVRPAGDGGQSLENAPWRSDLCPIHQDHPDVIDIGDRRTGQQEIAGHGEEGGGVVVVEIGFRIEAERRHLREGALI